MLDSDHLSFKVAATKIAPNHSIQPFSPMVVDKSKCEKSINVAVFFDGTNNNKDRDSPRLGDSNIARLFARYRRSRNREDYPLYVPGVGTRFPEIGEDGERMLGSGFAFGSETRVLFGICHVFNSICASATGEYFLSADQVAALCCNESVGSPFTSAKDATILRGMGFDTGLRIPYGLGESDRIPIYKSLAAELQKKLEMLSLKSKNV